MQGKPSVQQNSEWTRKKTFVIKRWKLEKELLASGKLGKDLFFGKPSFLEMRCIRISMM